MGWRVDDSLDRWEQVLWYWCANKWFHITHQWEHMGDRLRYWYAPLLWLTLMHARRTIKQQQQQQQIQHFLKLESVTYNNILHWRNEIHLYRQRLKLSKKVIVTKYIKMPIDNLGVQVDMYAQQLSQRSYFPLLAIFNVLSSGTAEKVGWGGHVPPPPPPNIFKIIKS